MSQPSSFGLYQPGTTAVHRLPAGPKLLALLLLGVVASVVPALPTGLAPLLVSAGVLIIGLCCWFAARLSFRPLRPLLVPTALLLMGLAAVQWWTTGWPAAVGTVARIVGLLAAAWAVTATTRVSAMLATITSALRPLDRSGRWAERIGLAVALAVRSIPLLGDGLQRAREARIARQAPAGLRGLPGLTVASVIHALRLADAMTEALIARGGVDRDHRSED